MNPVIISLSLTTGIVPITDKQVRYSDANKLESRERKVHINNACLLLVQIGHPKGNPSLKEFLRILNSLYILVEIYMRKKVQSEEKRKGKTKCMFYYFIKGIYTNKSSQVWVLYQFFHKKIASERDHFTLNRYFI